jgi:hypothetical protein
MMADPEQQQTGCDAAFRFHRRFGPHFLLKSDVKSVRLRVYLVVVGELQPRALAMKPAPTSLASRAYVRRRLSRNWKSASSLCILGAEKCSASVSGWLPAAAMAPQEPEEAPARATADASAQLEALAAAEPELAATKCGRTEVRSTHCPSRGFQRTIVCSGISCYMPLFNRSVSWRLKLADE